MTDQEERAALEARIAAQLKALDVATLGKVDALIQGKGEEPATPSLSSPAGLTRRQLLAGAAVGGAALVAGGVGGGVLGATWGDVQGSGRVRQEAAKTKQEADKEIAKLQGLLRLYENLERIGIDSLVGAAIVALELAFKGVKEGVLALRQAVEAIESALGNLEAAFIPLRSGLGLAEGFLSVLRGQLKLLQSAVYEVTGKLSPLTDALGGFFAEVIGKIPFGVGDKILEANKRIGELIGGLPDALEGINQQLLVPLRTDWLAEDEDKGLKGRLLMPLRNNLLKPLAKYLGDVASFWSDLEARLFTPAKAAIAERDKMRQQITQYKTTWGFPPVASG